MERRTWLKGAVGGLSALAGWRASWAGMNSEAASAVQREQVHTQPPPNQEAVELYPAALHGGPHMWNYYVPPAPGATPWAPCWSPDGKWIAVGMQGSVWKVNPLTGEASELTTTTAYASSPAWSPDGNWIVYTADHNRQRVQLEAINLASGESHALTDDGHVYFDPAFSPDGTRLAYVSSRPNGYLNIYVRAIHEGRWNGDELAVTRDHAYPRERLYFGRWDMHAQPAPGRGTARNSCLCRTGTFPSARATCGALLPERME